MKKAVFALLIFISFCCQSFAAEISYPPLTGRVVDTAGALTAGQKAEIANILAQDNDNQAAIAIVKNTQGLTGREYGLELARRWQLGQKGKDNGILLLLATEDRYAGIEVGYGLESILHDSLAGRILQQAVLPPLQKNGDYAQAALNGAQAIMAVISKDNQGAIPDETSAEDIFSLIFSLLVLYLILSGRIRPGGGIGLGGGSRGGFFSGGGGSFGGGGAGRRF